MRTSELTLTWSRLARRYELMARELGAWELGQYDSALCDRIDQHVSRKVLKRDTMRIVLGAIARRYRNQAYCRNYSCNHVCRVVALDTLSDVGVVASLVYGVNHGRHYVTPCWIGSLYPANI